MTKSAKSVERKRARGAPLGNKNAHKYGGVALVNRGETALEPRQRTRLQELREQFMSEPGRIEYRRDLAAFLALIVELGGANIRELAERGGNIWESSPIARLGTYLNSLIRLLDSWPKDERPMDITEILSGQVKDKDGNDGDA